MLKSEVLALGWGRGSRRTSCRIGLPDNGVRDQLRLDRHRQQAPEADQLRLRRVGAGEVHGFQRLTGLARGHSPPVCRPEDVHERVVWDARRLALARGAGILRRTRRRRGGHGAPGSRPEGATGQARWRAPAPPRLGPGPDGGAIGCSGRGAGRPTARDAGAPQMISEIRPARSIERVLLPIQHRVTVWRQSGRVAAHRSQGPGRRPRNASGRLSATKGGSTCGCGSSGRPSPSCCLAQRLHRRAARCTTCRPRTTRKERRG
jgi:hypothetical protein